MKTVGMVLLVVGTIVASLGGAKLPSASLPVAGAGLGLLVVALVLMRYKPKGAAATGPASSESAVLELVARLPERLDALSSEASELSLEELTKRLDAIDVELVAPIADGSGELLGPLGAMRFAEVFGAFASAERSLARTWSAAADGHRTEALASLENAKARALDARAALPSRVP